MNSNNTILRHSFSLLKHLRYDSLNMLINKKLTIFIAIMKNCKSVQLSFWRSKVLTEIKLFLNLLNQKYLALSFSLNSLRKLIEKHSYMFLTFEEFMYYILRWSETSYVISLFLLGIFFSSFSSFSSILFLFPSRSLYFCFWNICSKQPTGIKTAMATMKNIFFQTSWKWYSCTI